MKYFEILEPFSEKGEARCYIDNQIKLVQRGDLIDPGGYCTYKYHPEIGALSGDVLAAELIPEVEPVALSPEIKSATSMIKPYIKSLSTAVVDPSISLADLLPEKILLSFYSRREQAVLRFLREHNIEESSNYVHFSQVENLLFEISKRMVEFNQKKIRSEKQLSIIRSRQRFVKYDSKKTVTGRLSTKKGSFPIMTLSAKDRAFIKPTNDMFIEFDFNAAELRALLYFSGNQQPQQDIHQWNLKNVWTTSDLCRKSAKERFFAWLYNPNSVDHKLEVFYNKRAHLKHYKAGIIHTPFGRKIRVDQDRSLNYLLQSTSSDVNLEQAVKVDSMLRGKKTFVKFLMHDSLVLDVSSQDLGLMHQLYDLFGNTRLGKFMVNVSHGRDYSNMRSLKWKI